MFIPDALHEWSIGVTKRAIVHLIRILFAYDKNAVHEFNARYAPLSFTDEVSTNWMCSVSVKFLHLGVTRSDILETLFPK
jgi:hypothetical protein